MSDSHATTGVAGLLGESPHESAGKLECFFPERAHHQCDRTHETVGHHQGRRLVTTPFVQIRELPVLGFIASDDYFAVVIEPEMPTMFE